MLVLAYLAGDLTQTVPGEPWSASGHDDMHTADRMQVELGVQGTEDTQGQLVLTWLGRRRSFHRACPW